jgi:HrpA-like RNA helicase
VRLIHFYVDFRLRKPFQALRALQDARRTLPIACFEEQIVAAVRAHQVVLVAGDTGCGKSTQVPQFLLHAGFSRIACTQPRRLSAMALCRRVAFETMNAYGSQVAYQIRFDSTRTASTRILFLTEGVR